MIPSSPPVKVLSCEANTNATLAAASVIMAKKRIQRKSVPATNGTKKISNKLYEANLGKLQDELVKLKEWVRAKGLKVVRHSDGNIWSLMDVLLSSGYDGLNPLEPHAGMELKKVKAYCGDRICLLGNIDCFELLPGGTPQQVETAVKQAIEDAADGGGLIICSSNSLHPGVNPENCIAMFEATKKYGLYA